MYRTIDASFWTDPKVRKLSPNGRYLLLYFITNPHTHVSGIYYIPDLIAQHETGLSSAQLKAASDTLSILGFCRFDRTNELVWVVKMFRFQGNGQKNTLSAAHHLSKDVHNSFLISEFLQVYPEVAEHVKIPYPEIAVGATPHSPFPNTENGIQRTEQEPIGLREFEEIWNRYPNKDGRKEAERHFMAGVKTPQDIADLEHALQNYLAHLKANSWKQPKSGSTFFNNWRDWTAWVEPASNGNLPLQKREYTEAEREKAREEMRRDGIIQ